MQDMVKKLKRLYDEKAGIDGAITKMIPKAFPLNTTVTFNRGKGCVVAEVVDHGDDCVRIKSTTGKEYWIDAWWLLQE